LQLVFGSLKQKAIGTYNATHLCKYVKDFDGKPLSIREQRDVDPKTPKPQNPNNMHKIYLYIKSINSLNSNKKVMRQLTCKKQSNKISPTKPIKNASSLLKTELHKSSNSNFPAHLMYSSNSKIKAQKHNQNIIPSLKIDVSSVMPQKPKNQPNISKHSNLNKSLNSAREYQKPGNYLEYNINKSLVVDLPCPLKKQAPINSPPKCLLSGQSSKSMSDLSSLPKNSSSAINRSNYLLLAKRVSNLPSESSTPQIFMVPPLFPQSDKNEDTRRQLNLETEIDKLRKENIDLRGKLREKRADCTRIEYENAKLIGDLRAKNEKYKNMFSKFTELIENEQEFSKENLVKIIKEYQDPLENNN